MNKNAILIHGVADTPSNYWFPYISKYLEENGYEVWAPQMPDAANPSKDTWLPFVLENGTFSEDTVLVGHSAGAALILGILHSIDIQIHKAVMVSGFARRKGPKKEPKPILLEDYDWEKMKQNAKDIIIINSSNDPWHNTDVEGYHIWKNLGGTFIALEGEGHMGSGKFNQPYKEFPLLKSLLDLPVSRESAA